MTDTTMTLDQFTETLLKRLKEMADPDVKICLRKVTKNNGIQRTGCAVEKGKTQIAPVFYMEDYYIDYLRGAGIEDIANTLMNCALKSSKKDFPDMSFFDDYEEVRNHLAVRVIGTEMNREKLKEIPNRSVEDMSVTCYWLADDACFTSGTIQIDNNMLRIWNISGEQLFKDALENACRMLPPSITSMREMLGDICESDEADNMYVLTNEQDVFGAAVILYPNVLKQYAVALGKNLYILPSSINEMILIPEEDNVDYSSLGNIVREINRTEVGPEEVLTDSVYYYNRFTDAFHIAYFKH